MSDNYRYFEDLPPLEECEHHITWNDLDVLDKTDPDSMDYYSTLVKFCKNEMGVDVTWWPGELMREQIHVAICRWLDDNPEKYDRIWMY